MGPWRDLWKQYNLGEDDSNVAYAIVAGILNRGDMLAELLDALARQLNFYQSLKEEGRLRLPGD
jgi:hypothetical protein